jgi:hypothetical protein
MRQRKQPSSNRVFLVTPGTRFFAHAYINVKIAAMVIDVHQLMKH